MLWTCFSYHWVFNFFSWRSWRSCSNRSGPATAGVNLKGGVIWHGLVVSKWPFDTSLSVSLFRISPSLSPSNSSDETTTDSFASLDALCCERFCLFVNVMHLDFHQSGPHHTGDTDRPQRIASAVPSSPRICDPLYMTMRRPSHFWIGVGREYGTFRQWVMAEA